MARLGGSTTKYAIQVITHKTALFAFMALAFISFGAAAQPYSAPAETFTPGQVWSIKPASGIRANVVIVRIEPWRGTIVVHVSAVDIVASQVRGDGDQVGVIGHMPFAQDALAASVGRLIRSGGLAVPGFEEGYKQWLDDRGGAFTIGVAQAIAATIEAMQAPRGR